MTAEYLCIAIVALAWGGYPLLARSSGVGSAIGALVLTLSALVPITATTLWQGGQLRLSGGQLSKLMLAGCMMGVGTTAFNYVANSRAMDASISIPIIDTAMLLVTVLAAVFLFAEPMTQRKGIGILLLLAGIIVLRPE